MFYQWIFEYNGPFPFYFQDSACEMQMQYSSEQKLFCFFF